MPVLVGASQGEVRAASAVSGVLPTPRASAQGEAGAGIHVVAVDETAVSGRHGPGFQALWWPGDSCLRPLACVIRRVLERYGTTTGPGLFARQDQDRW